MAVDNLEKKLYTYLQKIALSGIMEYNNINNPNSKLIIKGGVLLRSYIKAKRIVPDIIDDENLMSYDIDTTFKFRGIRDDEIQNYVRTETDLLYNHMINKLTPNPLGDAGTDISYIDVFFYNIEKILASHGYRLDLPKSLWDYESDESNTRDKVKNILKQFLKLDHSHVMDNPDKKLGKIFISLRKINPPHKKKIIRFLDITYIVEGTTNPNFIDTENAQFLSTGLPTSMNYSLNFMRNDRTHIESFYNFIYTLIRLAYRGQPGSPFLGVPNHKAPKYISRVKFLIMKYFLNEIV